VEAEIGAAELSLLALFLELGETAGGLVRDLGRSALAQSGERSGQYRLDLVADACIVDGLLGAGLTVLSEESGLRRGDRGRVGAGAASGSGWQEGERVVVVDPIDGSTNASRGLRWWATSFAVVEFLDGVWSLVSSLVIDHGRGDSGPADVFAAVAGKGAFRNGAPLPTAPVRPLADAIVGMNGLPPRRLGWAQTRTFGALALDLSAVATGALDGYLDAETVNHAPWDYLGGMLVLRECGGEVLDGLGRDLIVVDHEARRSPVAATSPALCAEWVERARPYFWSDGG
jgi:fructose-1,6-bisphosphatase/inositol monophosphatase family enzyme